MVRRSQPASSRSRPCCGSSRPSLRFCSRIFVVGVDLGDGFYPGIVGSNEIFAGVFLVPVENAANERRDEFDAAFCAGDRLSERKQEREVAVDALFLE